ncbi:MAG: DNA translocase FtsK [Oscillospiraceae bacterium]|nr:DNA translocase FtsK [Oscillospiraceae bacterium]
MAVMICISCRVSVKKTVEELRSHVYPPYEPEPEPEIAPQPIRTVAAPRRVPASVPRSEIFDIPMDKEPERIGNRDKTYRTRSRKENWIDVPIDGDPENDELSALERKILDMPQGVIYHGEKPAAPTRSRREKPEPVPVEIPAAEAVDFTAERPAQSVFLKQGLSEIQSEPPKEGKASPGEIQSAVEEISQAIQEAEETREYLYPPIDLLRSSPGITSDGRDEVSLNRERLEATLRSFGIGASISEITRGPTVTRYDLELEAGVKLNKLTNLAGDLALSLGVVNVRIAPIPDKISTVGVEVPNKIVSTVYLRDIIDSAAFRNAKSKLSFAVGKDIAGNCIVGNISKMPHMLIAGTTGSGKSVCMNSLILSLLYKATPEEVRLIMIDPKMVELGIYNGIPHLYIPVVTDPKKAAGSLQWAVVEMMKRYRLFSEVGVRDLVGYNNYMSRSQQPTMPNVVIVIDELADLMLTAAKEVEESICRVAQMGRAAGIHLVIATQRPSADVITGLMKANIPSRIAFAVSSALESRIILDQQGAEKLIGMGDMLYFPLGSGKPLRVQGAFVSDEERENVIKFIKERSKADYDETIMQTIEQAAKDKEKAETGSDSDASGSAEGGSPFAGYDELLPQAVEVLLDTKQASVSMLQRRLKLGYSRAARLVDQMEELGIVGPFEGSKPRQLLITREQWQEMSMTGNTAVEKLINESKDDFSEELS